jgi:hypothetical protein
MHATLKKRQGIMLKWPVDSTPYPQDTRSRFIAAGLPDGGYVYVQDDQGQIWILPDGPHFHPKVLGGGKPALYAGDLTIHNGRVIDVTNLSGTFQFVDEAGLLNVADELCRHGLAVDAGAVRFFPADGSMPVILR